MSDPIGEWVEASLERGQARKTIETCRNCPNQFHGLPLNGCPGSHIKTVNPDDIHDAILDWTDDWFVLGDN